ncbi:uncharacterized protein LOC128883552 isoform X2 [Hylaeus volcanicus]|uniref:uncharacterized protein LOC128883552 isoform X2 n=1 Tax=Hylaeus volcanicus TaxID=313075 RepID=UPI0023B7B441|nr:uncharacterized protein LOC128883552 isoform X2 [Hylaeus volcanicus]
MNELCNVSFCKTHSHASVSDDAEKMGINIESCALITNVSSLGYPLLNSSTSHQNAFADSVVIVANTKNDMYEIKPNSSLNNPTLVEPQSSNGQASHNTISQMLNDETLSISLSSLMESEKEKIGRDVNPSAQDSWEQNLEQLMSLFAQLCLETMYFRVKRSKDDVENLVKIQMDLERRILQLQFQDNQTLHLPLSEITFLNDDNFQEVLVSNSTQFLLNNGDVCTLQGFEKNKQKNIIFFFGLYFLRCTDTLN